MKMPVQNLAEYLSENNLSVAFAESMTCGCAAHCMGNVSGTSDFFKGSVVCYDEQVKTGLFKISPLLIKKYTAESQEVTDALVRKLKKLIKADIHAAITGLAVQGGSEHRLKPVGTVFFAVLYKRKVYSLQKRFRGSPLAIKEKACDELFRFLVNILKKV